MKSFQPAVKYESKLRLGIVGPSGSGKTWTGLAIGSGLGDRIAVVDTEHGSAAKYANNFDFDHVALDPPYTPERFIALIAEAVAEGYDVLILDSISHAWAGTGGVLEMKEDFAQERQYNDFTAWRPAGKAHNSFIEAILASDIHMICTMRSKKKYAQEKNEQGKQVITKLGMQPIAQPDTEYEFDVVLAMDMEHNGVVEKTRCPDLDKKRVYALPGEELATVLLAWLAGEERPPEPHWSVTNHDQYTAKLLNMGMTESEALGLLGLESIADYKKTGKAFFAELDAAWDAALKDEAHENAVRAKEAEERDPADPTGTGGYDDGGERE